MRRRLWGFAVCCVVAAPVHAQKAKVGHPAPDFVLASLTGDSSRLSQFHGHPVVLKFWATWCPTCRTEMPELIAARDAHRTEGLVIITVDSDDKPTHIRSFLAKLTGVDDLPVLIDPDRRVQDRYRIPLLPTTVFIDTTGVVRVLHAGAIRQDELTQGLQSILPHQE